MSDESEIRFECTLCGSCCRGRQDVWLNGDDLELLRVHLKLPTTRDLWRDGWIEETKDENGKKRPRIRFKTKPLRFCPFLVNDLKDSGLLEGRCSLHPDFKPLVCHLAPLYRWIEDDGKSWSEIWGAAAPDPECPGMGRGPTLELRSPPELGTRLTREVEWMRKAGENTPTGGKSSHNPQKEVE